MKKLRTFAIEINWLPFTNHGWGNGYVIIPKGHPLHGKDYNEIEGIDVHGGITLSESANGLTGIFRQKRIPKDCWILGFDTAHFADTLETWPKKRVLKELNDFRLQCEQYSLDK